MKLNSNFNDIPVEIIRNPVEIQQKVQLNTNGNPLEYQFKFD